MISAPRIPCTFGMLHSAFAQSSASRTCARIRSSPATSAAIVITMPALSITRAMSMSTWVIDRNTARSAARSSGPSTIRETTATPTMSTTIQSKPDTIRATPMRSTVRRGSRDRMSAAANDPIATAPNGHSIHPVYDAVLTTVSSRRSCERPTAMSSAVSGIVSASSGFTTPSDSFTICPASSTWTRIRDWTPRKIVSWSWWAPA